MLTLKATTYLVKDRFLC